MLQLRTVIYLFAALLLAVSPPAAMAGEGRESDARDSEHQGGASQVEQIGGNYQATRQTGSNNTATVVQSAVAAGLVPNGTNIAIVAQEGTGNDADVRQKGDSLQGVIEQRGDANAASIDQSGAGLSARIGQFGDGGGAQIFQSGVGNGLPVIVRQY
jgi:hypothetical protein